MFVRGVAAAILGVGAMAQAATITVTTTNDPTLPVEWSLRNAILQANTGPGLDTILVPAGTYRLMITSSADEDAGVGGDLDVTNSMIIQGDGPGQTIIDASSLTNNHERDRVFEFIGANMNFTLRDLTIRGGLARPGTDGGAIQNEGNLTLINVVIEDNAIQTSPVSTPGGRGGGIYSTGPLTILDSWIRNNQSGSGANNTNANANAGGFGGGIWTSGMLVMSNSTVSGNQTGDAGDVTGANGGLNGGFGGGLYAQAPYWIVNSTFSGNRTGNGGDSTGGTAGRGGWGAGLYLATTGTILHTTIVSNQVGNSGYSGLTFSFAPPGSGGGLYAVSKATLYHTLIQGNTIPSSTITLDIGGIVESAGVCLITSTNGAIFTMGIDDQYNVTTPIGPLQDNGGPTPTHALVPGGPAVDVLNNDVWPFAPERSQNDVNRNAGGAIDVGAYEVPFFVQVATTTPDRNALDVAPNQAVSLTFVVPSSAVNFNSTNVIVRGSYRGIVPGSYSTNRIFTPSSPGLPGETISVVLREEIQDTNGDPLIPYTWSYTIAAAGCSNVTFYSSQGLSAGTAFRVALGDLDGDGDLDAFFANLNANRVWLNNGSGTFTDSGQSLGNSASTGVDLGDLDGDGDLDAFVANTTANRVWLNNGAGVFTDSGQSLGNSISRAVALGDVDLDGDLDAFVANDGANRVWLNDGDGVFANSGQSLGNSNSPGIELGDLDGDGDLDAFVVGGSSPVWLNDGAGIFTNNGQTLPVVAGIGLGDLDGDSDLDAFVVGGAGNQVWTNNGSGTFADSGQSLGLPSSEPGIALGDLDGDGDLDAFEGVGIPDVPSPDRVWLNDGDGTFSSGGTTLGGDTILPRPALGDLDGDGDLDAFVADFDGAERVMLNLHCLDTGDLDGDGIPNNFELDYPSLSPTNAADAGSDGDLDGQTALEEYIAGTDPTDSNSFFRINLFFIQGGFQVWTGFETLPDRVYAVEYTESLTPDPQNWTQAGDTFTSDVNPFVTSIGITASTSRIYRIRVQLAP